LVRIKKLGFVPCTRGLNMRWRAVPPSNGCLGFLIRRDSPVDMEAFTGRIVAIVGRVRVRGAKIVI
jgi:hypothetical protein